MLEMGDELWRTQGGNNNAYCQDSELTWLDWRTSDDGREMRRTAAALISLRRRLGALVQRGFLHGTAAFGGVKDITWLQTDGTEMQLGDWQAPVRATLAFRLAGQPSVIVLMNAELAPVTFRLPDATAGEVWRTTFDTRDAREPSPALRASHTDVELGPGSLVVLVAGAVSEPGSLA